MRNIKQVALVSVVALLIASPALAQIEPRVVPGSFPTNYGDGGAGIFPVPSGPGVVAQPYPTLNANEARGLVTFDLNWHAQYGNGVLNTADQSLTVIYTIDGKPVSPRIPSPYTWTWDSTTVPDGSHVASLIVVSGTWDGATPYNGYAPTSTHLIVDNVPGPVLGPQKLASLGNGESRVYQRTALPERITWNTGYMLPHPATTVPYVAPISPPAATRGLPDGGLSLPFISEPLTQANITVEATALLIARTKTGHIFVDNYNVVGPNSADAALPHVLAQPLMDGPRNDNGVSPYATYIPWGRGFWGIDLGGRMFALNLDGSVKTVAGRQINRDIVPYTPNDPSITEADRRALGQVQIIGDFHGQEWNQPNDLAADPRDHHIVYVADTENGRITKTVFSSTAVPDTTTYATGFVAPSSVIVGADGTVYVADYEAGEAKPTPDTTGTISKITPDGTKSLLATIANQPFAIRFDSKGNIIVLTLIDNELLRLDSRTGAVTSIYKTGCNWGWTWLEVDAKGNIGPVDDMFITCQKQEYIGWRVSADGSRVTGTPMSFGHYPWAVSIANNEARILLHGFGDTAPTSWRLPAPGDPTPATMDQYTRANVWPIIDRFYWLSPAVWGTVQEFPVGAHPSQAALRGYGGYSPLYGTQSFDDIANLPADQIGAWVNAGLGGSSPRPEIVGRDLQLVVQDIQMKSAGFPNSLYPWLPPPPTDVIPPVISDVRVTVVDSVTAKVSWTTDKPTLGYVRFGTAAKSGSPLYYRFSPLETGFGTAHAATLSDLPDNATIHYAVVVEDQTPNFTGTPDHTFQTGVVPPPPVPTASLTAAPTSVQVGQASALTWGSTNATACPGTGFPGGGPSGSAVVKPAATTAYAVDCTGLGGTAHAAATVTVTTPPPPLFPALGSRMKLTVPVGVYAAPSETGKKLCTQAKGQTGSVIGSAIPWLQINYASGCDGWSIYQTMTAP